MMEVNNYFITTVVVTVKAYSFPGDSMDKKCSIPVVTIGSKEGSALLKKIVMARADKNQQAERTVKKILDDIRATGDTALFYYTKKFDAQHLTKKTVRLSREYIALQAEKVPAPLKKTIREAAKRIYQYHARQKINGNFSLKTREGVLKQMILPLNRVGVYIPGGYTAYPSTVLMDIIPAKIAGVREIAAVTPPAKTGLSPAIAYVLNLLDVQEVYQIGGAQAIGALAYGTQTIPCVDAIVGPGNRYVALAKKMVYGTVAIDSITGPSEVAILADSSARPEWVALDLLSQAEHGTGDETAVCVTEHAGLARRIASSLQKEIASSPVRRVFERLPPHAIAIFIGRTRDESIAFINALAPEHLQIMTKTYRHDVKKIRNAAALFLGSYTPVALGDYFVGTNHVLPTGSTARYASPLGVDNFLKRISVAEIDAGGLCRTAQHVSRFARAEGFVHHALSVERRAARIE